MKYTIPRTTLIVETEYCIRGGTVPSPEGGCGIYGPFHGKSYMDYAAIDPSGWVADINRMPKNKAIEETTKLRDLAAAQAAWKSTPDQSALLYYGEQILCQPLSIKYVPRLKIPDNLWMMF